MRGEVGTRTVGKLAISSLILLAGAALLGGRAVADSYEVREYASPMTVETVFVMGDHALWGAKWYGAAEYERLAGSICEHVKITQLEMNIENAPKPRVKKGQTPPPELVKLGIRGRIKNEFGGDKVATLRFEVLSGEEVTASVNVKVSVEDDEERGFKGFATVPPSVLPSDPAATMRLTMSVEED